MSLGENVRNVSSDYHSKHEKLSRDHMISIKTVANVDFVAPSLNRIENSIYRSARVLVRPPTRKQNPKLCARLVRYFAQMRRVFPPFRSAFSPLITTRHLPSALARSLSREDWAELGG